MMYSTCRATLPFFLADKKPHGGGARKQNQKLGWYGDATLTWHLRWNSAVDVGCSQSRSGLKNGKQQYTWPEIKSVQQSNDKHPWAMKCCTSHVQSSLLCHMNGEHMHCETFMWMQLWINGGNCKELAKKLPCTSRLGKVRSYSLPSINASGSGAFTVLRNTGRKSA